MLVWVGQTDNWRYGLNNLVNSLMDMAAEGYELIKLNYDERNDEDVEVILEDVFEKCNIGNEVRKLKHSLSVGDVVILYRNGKYEVFMCESVGWRKIGESKIFP